MDPLTITVSVSALLGVLAKLTNTTTNAFNCAQALEDSERRYGQITKTLQSAVKTIQRLNDLRGQLARLDDVRVQGRHISLDDLEQFVEATEALHGSLDIQRKRMQGFRRAWTKVKLITQPELVDVDLQRDAQRFTESMGCLNILLEILHLSLTLSVREVSLQTLSQTNSNQSETLAKLESLSSNHSEALAKLDAVSSNFRTPSGQKLSDVSENTAEQVSQIVQTLAVTQDNINGVRDCQQLIDRQISVLVDSTRYPTPKESWFGVP